MAFNSLPRIALVPLITVALAIFSAFPMFGKLQLVMQKWLVESLVPDNIARPVLRALTEFAGKARGIEVELVAARADKITDATDAASRRSVP